MKRHEHTGNKGIVHLLGFLHVTLNSTFSFLRIQETPNGIVSITSATSQSTIFVPTSTRHPFVFSTAYRA